MANIAIIPARGGSKRIPKKNIRDFLGQPIISYSIKSALDSKLFDEIMVSTDDQEIVKIALQHGANVPFIRSKKNSDDFAGTAEVLIEVLEQYKQRSIHFDNCCCIYPTAPFITPETLKNTFHKFDKDNFDSVFPIIMYSYPIQRSLKINQGKTEMLWPSNYCKRSQDLEPVYHDAGQFYWLRINALMSERKLWPKNTGSMIISELEAQDIDDISDWKIAEIKYKLLNEK